MAKPIKKVKSLYWSSLKTYEECPQKFLFKYGAPGIDVGGGPGKPKPIPEQRSEHHMMMGTVIQYAIERFYNDELWKGLRSGDLSTKELVSMLKDITRKSFNQETTVRHIDWREAPAPAEMLDTCIKGVIGYLKTMKANHLLGEFAKAEYLLLGYIDDNTPVGGRVDTIIRRDEKPGRPAPGFTIIDGKNSKHKMKYTDPDQLRWYALLLYLSHGVLPDRLGFAFYRYPYGTPVEGEEGEIEQGVEWVEYDRGDIRGLAQRAVEARRAIGQKEFEANPVPKVCRFCDWEKVCTQRQAQRKANARKRGRKKKPVDPALQDLEGFTTIGFD